MPGAPPFAPVNKDVWVCRLTPTVLQRVGETFTSNIAFSYVTKLVPNVLAWIVGTQNNISNTLLHAITEIKMFNDPFLSKSTVSMILSQFFYH